jgi:hypothetical protein
MTTTSTPTRASTLSTAFLAGSVLLVVLVLVQAAMAGQALFEGFDIVIHGYVGNASFTLGVVLLALALFGRLSRPLMVLAAVNMVLLFGQTGLGYVGRDETWAASVHVPLGVTIFGLTMVQATLALLDRQRRTP